MPQQFHHRSSVCVARKVTHPRPKSNWTPPAYQARCSRREDGWRPPVQETTEKQAPLASVDDAIEQRNRRLENAWKSLDTRPTAFRARWA